MITKKTAAPDFEGLIENIIKNINVLTKMPILQVIGRPGPSITGKGSNSVSPALSTDHLQGGGEGHEEGKRQITPDIIKVNC